MRLTNDSATKKIHTLTGKIVQLLIYLPHTPEGLSLKQCIEIKKKKEKKPGEMVMSFTPASARKRHLDLWGSRASLA